jgi:hypothetical protein
MIRNLIFVSPILFSLNALASEVKITSFRYLEAAFATLPLPSFVEN